MSRQAHNAYLEGKILAADPLTLVCVLYDTALQNVQKARDRLRDGDIPARSKAITKALQALHLLAASLNLEAGGELGRNLLELYLYMQKRLVAANVQQSDSILAEVQSLLANLRESWAQLAAAESSSQENAPNRIPSGDGSTDRLHASGAPEA